ncbi:MAG: hypothetical protein WC159_13495 [Sphaerochaetaceae bacterium]
MDDTFVLIRCDSDFYVTRSKRAFDMASVLVKFGKKKKVGRYVHLFELEGTCHYVDAELLESLRIQLINKTEFAKLSAVQLSAYLASDETKKKEFALALLRSKQSRSLIAIDAFCCLVLVICAFWLLVR